MASNTKKYVTHDNGGRPYLVVRKGTTVEVFHNKTKGECGERICRYENIAQFFEGEDPIEGFLGNSVLFGPINGYCPRKFEYVFVGACIFSFNAPCPVTDYVSPTWRNDVPLPYAATHDRVYILTEGVYVYRANLRIGDYTVESWADDEHPLHQYHSHKHHEDWPWEKESRERLSPEDLRHEELINLGRGHEFERHMIKKREV